MEELTDDVRSTEEANMDLKADRSRLQVQIEEIRSQMRNQMQKYMNDNVSVADR